MVVNLGAEIMVEDNTLYVDGVPKVVIAPADEADLQQQQSSMPPEAQTVAQEPPVHASEQGEDDTEANDNAILTSQAPVQEQDVFDPSSMMIEPPVHVESLDANEEQTRSVSDKETNATSVFELASNVALQDNVSSTSQMISNTNTETITETAELSSDHIQPQVIGTEDDFLNVPVQEPIVPPNTQSESGVQPEQTYLQPPEATQMTTQNVQLQPAEIVQPDNQLPVDFIGENMVNSMFVGNQEQNPTVHHLPMMDDQMTIPLTEENQIPNQQLLVQPDQTQEMTVMAHSQEQQPIEAEEQYIDLSNLDLSNVDLPPGNYNLVINELGEAVFVETDVIDENTIQIVAQ